MAICLFFSLALWVQTSVYSNYVKCQKIANLTESRKEAEKKLKGLLLC